MPEGSPFGTPPIDWLKIEPGILEVAGVSVDGVLYWSEIDSNSETAPVATACLSGPNGSCFRAVAMLAPGHVVGVTATNDVVWSKVVYGQLVEWSAPQRLPFPARAVAALARPPAGDLVIIVEDGAAVRLSIPRWSQ